MQDVIIYKNADIGIANITISYFTIYYKKKKKNTINDSQLAKMKKYILDMHWHVPAIKFIG